MNEQELGPEMKSYIGLLALKRATLETKDGEMKLNNKNCLVDIPNITSFDTYLKKEGYNIEKGKNKLGKNYVIPLQVKMSDGKVENFNIIVNSEGQDVSLIYEDKEIKVSNRMQNEIISNATKNEGLTGKADTELMREVLSPKTLEELAREIENDTLVPNNSMEALNKIKEKAPNTDIKLTDEQIKENDKKGTQNKEREPQEKDDEIKKVPEEVRDEVARLCSEHNYDISALKEVMIVNPKVITEKLEATELAENGPNVYCLRFRDAKLNDRIVMAQPGKTPVDKETYDEPMRQIMDERRYRSINKTIEDEHDKIYFTDIDGNTTVAEMRKEPRDLTCDDKELIQKEFEKLDESAKIILNSDMPIEQKAEELQKINEKRLDLFKDFGIKVPTIEEEIKADNEIHEKVEEEHKLPEEHELPAGPWDNKI